jgi:hypothetical protein
MAEETGRHLNDAITAGAGRGLGLGQAAGAYLADRRPAFAKVSLLCTATRLESEAIGAASLRDFRYFTSFVAHLQGGVYLNCGSAVILPEVLLKAVSLVRNRGISLDGLTTVNFDFVRLYRPETNVVRRPVAGIGHGYSITGHHELMLPLLAAALVA